MTFKSSVVFHSSRFFEISRYHGIKQWILKWYLQRLSKLEFFYIGIYFLFCSPKSVREQLLFFSEGRSGFSWFWKITQQFSTGCQKDCIGFAFLRFVIGPQNSHTLSHQSEAKLKSHHDLVTRVFRALGS